MVSLLFIPIFPSFSCSQSTGLLPLSPTKAQRADMPRHPSNSFSLPFWAGLIRHSAFIFFWARAIYSSSPWSSFIFCSPPSLFSLSLLGLPQRSTSGVSYLFLHEPICFPHELSLSPFLLLILKSQTPMSLHLHCHCNKIMY